MFDARALENKVLPVKESSPASDEELMMSIFLFFFVNKKLALTRHKCEHALYQMCAVWRLLRRVVNVYENSAVREDMVRTAAVQWVGDGELGVTVGRSEVQKRNIVKNECVFSCTSSNSNRNNEDGLPCSTACFFPT